MMTTQLDVNMEEREALKRQIELLQNLINNHKSVHGDAPSSAGPRQQERATSARGHAQSSYAPPSQTPSGVLNLPVPAGQWRKTYSISNKRYEALQNKPTQTPVSMSSSGSSSRSLQATRAGRSSSQPSHCPRADLVDRESGGAGGVSGGSCARGRTLPSATEVSSCGQRDGAGDEAGAATTTPALARTGAPPDDSQKQLKQTVQSRHEASKFTWVKSQEAGGSGPPEARAEPLLPETFTSPAAPAPDSNAGACGGPSPSLGITKKTPAKKVPRRLSLSAASPKTSKYTWVSSSAGGQSKISRKPLSPRALALLHRAPERGEAARRGRAAQALTGKQRKGAGASSSRYCWKAGAQGVAVVAGTGRVVPHRGSAFCWSSENEAKGSTGRARVEPSSSPVASHSPGGFKLRSRMKIIRKSPNGGGGPERRASPAGMTVRSRYSLHRRTTHTLVRTHTPGRSPGAPKRSPSRELVSFGRHKLRRLSPGSSRTGPVPVSPRSPASLRVFRTRYKMVTKQGGASAHTPHHYSPALAWRTKRIQSARSLLQNRLRSPQDRHSPVQPWRGRDMRWIGGSLYRVSANKLSRTAAAGVSINRTATPPRRWCDPQEGSPSGWAAWGRPSPSSTRHVASRAVQKSLAIIRQQARLKKQHKHYCMYYNRFGKCNRGDKCPFIHDPDKVAVCTRFLRGTCKQTDGTCPFSHKVAKEKMPVCSYFLRGICNNSSCPYSHVYVSSKAAVCQDFLRGYCPQGEKCKKKHTLVCPDFSSSGSCPRGSSCKLRHRQRAGRGAPPGAPGDNPTKRARTRDTPHRPGLSILIPPGPDADARAEPGPAAPPAGPHALPSFISLSSSSPEEADAPATPPHGGAGATERKLQIKPRL